MTALLAPMQEKLIHRVFRISLWLKAATSVAEILAGAALAMTTHETLMNLARLLTSAELIEDPGDVVANSVHRAVATFSPSSQSFAAYYLLSHGLLKLAMVVGVLANRVWAYPAFIVILIGFIAYQVYKLSHHVSLGMMAITLLDVIVLVLAWHEYRLVRQARSA